MWGFKKKKVTNLTAGSNNMVSFSTFSNLLMFIGWMDSKFIKVQRNVTDQAIKNQVLR